MSAPAPSRGVYRRVRRPVRAVVVGAGICVLAAACSCSRDEATPPTTTRPAPTTTEPPPVFPLRGTQVQDKAAATRPALVIKVDNVAEARPQAGLNDADMVYEEKVEGGLSRLAAVFHALQPAAVGPVRSGRVTDVAIVSSLNRPLYAYSGANPRTDGVLATAPLINVGYTQAPEAYDRMKGRPAPHDLWTRLDKLRARTPPEAGPPPAALTFGTAPLPADAVPGVSAAYDFGSADSRATFAWDPAANGWARTQNGTPDVDTDGKVVSPANVVLQMVDYVDTGDTDVRGTPVPEARLVGQGTAWILTRGALVRAKWSRPDVNHPTDFRTTGDAAIAFTPGQTWIALLPVGGNLLLAKPDGTPAV